MVGDFGVHLDRLPEAEGRLVAFLGGTIGNLTVDERARFLTTLAARLRPGEGLLLGVDLVKDPARLVAAYDDSAGVTAEFERNVLQVVNTAWTPTSIWTGSTTWPAGIPGRAHQHGTARPGPADRRRGRPRSLASSWRTVRRSAPR